MHYSISLFCIYRGGRGSFYEKVVVTKGIFPPQPLHHSRGAVVGKKNKKTNPVKSFFQTVSSWILMWDKDKIFPDSGDAQVWIPLSEKERKKKKRPQVMIWVWCKCRVGSARGN